MSNTSDQKPATKRTPNAAFSAALTPSPELAAVIGAEPSPRTEVTKKIWDYIKAHNLQDPQDKRTLIADEKLRPLFEADRIGMFKLAGIAGKHLS